MTFRERFELLEKRREALRATEAALEAEKQARLAALPAEHGFLDLAAFVRAVRATASAKSPQRKPAKRKARAQPIPPQPPAPHPPPAAPVTPPPPVAVSDSLDDPANFALLPDRSVLEQGGMTTLAQKDRLAEALRFCTRVLHTSKVPAAVWREWRGFERELQDALRAVRPA